MAAQSPVKMVFGILRAYWLVWIIPTAISTAGATFYATTIKKEWHATQNLVVRDDLSGEYKRPGRFESLEQMKAAEQTVQTVARNRSVVAAALKQLPPAEDYRDATEWPSAEYVESVRDKVSLTAPNGAEFGHTEIVQLNVRDLTPDRTLDFIRALTEETEKYLNQLRENRAASIEAELTKAITVAEKVLEGSHKELEEIEKSVGPDLSDLRSLSEPSSGEVGTKKLLSINREESVKTQIILDTQTTQLKELATSLADESHIFNVPESLLITLPTVQRLRTGLVEVKLKRADALSLYAPTHQKVVGFEKSLERIATDLKNEIKGAHAQLEREVQGTTEKLNALKQQESQLVAKVDRVNALRIPYTKLVHDVEQRKVSLSKLRADLEQVHGMRSVDNGSVVARFGDPQLSVKAIGPSRVMIAGGGVIAGLAFGFGLVALLYAPRGGASDNLAQLSSSPPQPIRPTDFTPIQFPTNEGTGIGTGTNPQIRPVTGRDSRPSEIRPAVAAAPTQIAASAISQPQVEPAGNSVTEDAIRRGLAEAMAAAVSDNRKLNQPSPIQDVPKAPQIPVAIPQTTRAELPPPDLTWDITQAKQAAPAKASKPKQQAVSELEGEILELRAMVEQRRLKALEEAIGGIPASPAPSAETLVRS